MAIQIRVKADFALFARTELSNDRYSYDMIPPSAARGVFDSIYWHPGLSWIIDKIWVINPIKFVDLNPMSNKHECALRNVEYVIQAHFNMTADAAQSDNDGKFISIFKRRLNKHDYYRDLYLGAKEYPAQADLCTGKPISSLRGKNDLGLMLYDYNFEIPDIQTPRFFRAVLYDGLLDLTKKPTIS